MEKFFTYVFLLLVDFNALVGTSSRSVDDEKHGRFKRIVGGNQAAPPPVDEPMVYVIKEDHFAKVFGSRQGVFPNSYYRFVGLRYAEPPVGKYRFQRPKKVKLEGDVNGLKYPPPCLQPNPDAPNKVVGSEDCLFLNVYTPRLPDSGALLPVLFWIHGGGYRRGSASQYGGGYLTRRDVVVVTVQYRLGALGFLSANEKNQPGNAAMFDLTAAAEWVKNYIEFFGGDPKNIVPMGQGSGASSAMFMGISNVTQGRAKGMIAMSGTPLSPFALDDAPNETSKKLAEKSGCPVTSTIEMVNCLRQLPPEKIVMSESAIEKQELSRNGAQGIGTIFTSAPVVEDTNDYRFLPAYLEEEPRTSLDSNHIPKIPLLTGVTKHETAGAVAGTYRKNLVNQLKKVPDFLNQVLLPGLVERNKKRLYSVGSLTNNVLQFLTGNYLSSTTKNLQDSLNQVIEATSDALFNFPAYLTSTAWAKQDIPTFFYSFDHIGKLKGVRQLLKGSFLINQEEDEEEVAATHGSDLPYLFDIRSLDGTPYDFHNESTPLDPDDEKVRNNMLDLITNFAKNSNQMTTNKGSGFPSYLSILPESRLEEHFRQCQMSLWSGVKFNKPCLPLSFVISPIMKGVEGASELLSNKTGISLPSSGKLPGSQVLGGLWNRGQNNRRFRP